MMQFDFGAAQQALNTFLTSIGGAIIIFIVLSLLIYFYSSSKTGPLGVRGKYIKPFMYSTIVLATGLLLGFIYYISVGLQIDFTQQTSLAIACLGLGILFGMSAFIHIYRRDT